MSSHEVSHSSNFEPSNPLGLIDHAAVCEKINQSIDNFPTVREALLSEQDHQMEFDRPLYDAFLNIAEYLIPLEPNGTLSQDVTRKRIFVAGMVLAFATVDTICDSLGVDLEAFHKIWSSSGTIKVIDINADVFKDKTRAEKYEAVGDGIVHAGHVFLSNMDQNYLTTIDKISDNYDTLTDPNLFKVCYGYVLGSAMQTFARMFQELEVRRVLSEENIDNGINYLLEEPIPVRYPNDDRIADTIDTEIFYVDDDEDSGVESYIDKEIEEQLDVNNEVIETLQSLALVLYPNELGNGALDEDGEAFFYGSVLALKYKNVICQELSLASADVNRKWRQDSTHAKLYEMEFIPETREKDVDTQVIKTLQQTELSRDTAYLADKICDKLHYEASELVAFKNGLQYTLETYKKAADACIKRRIDARVMLARQTLDDDIDRLLNSFED